MKFSLTVVTTFLVGSLMAQGSEFKIIKDRLSLENSKVPTYMEFSPEARPSLDDLDGIFTMYFKKETNFSFIEIGREVDQLGFTHIRYEQAYKGVAIELAEIIAHTKNNEIYSLGGKLVDSAPVSTNELIDESAALQAAKNYIGAASYKWEITNEENHLKMETNDPSATYFPTAELKYISKEVELNSSNLKLAYKFNIYAQEPLSRQEVYVDASNGEIVFTNNLIHTANVPGTAVTAYSGTQTITVDSLPGSTNSFRLRQTQSGSGVYTFNMLTGTSYANSVDFTDTDNNWNNVNVQRDQYATDAHWGAEKTYDYFFTKHGRNSINNNGFALNSYLHYDNNFNNAFWDGQRMTYGDGNAVATPLCALDVAGHEIAHGLTTFTADLIYASESGALNESFSDIFGAAIEFYARPSRANWTIGEDIGSSFRSMSNPKQFGDPDTRGGTNWLNVVGCTPSRFNDQCGVHINSGVQNHWFYLLTVGGTGVNDNNATFSVNGLGLDTAAAIAFRNLTIYLTQSSNFDDARFFSIQSAIDLYGDCSPQVQSVINAWHAVGVGNAYSPGVTSAFASDFTSSCEPPLTITFENNSNNGTVFTWDFGDGTTSTQRNPVHTYTNYGQYDVKMVADGGLCGIDSNSQVSYIDIDSANACIVLLQNGTNTTQTACTGKLFDSGGAAGSYSGNENGVITISPANAATVDLTFIQFDVEAGQGSSCNFDFLEVFDGASVNSPSLGVFCNNNIPTTISSTTGSITIRFISDGLVSETGFEIDWSCNQATATPVAGFTLSTTTSCDGLVDFSDVSTQAPSSWLWNFGDGNTSTLQHPSHTYTSNGSFNVSLVASNSFGTDTKIQSNAITISRPVNPSGTNDSSCIGQAAIITASASGALSWYSGEFGGSPVASGNSVTINNMITDSTLWVENLIASPIQTVGPVSFTIGNGANSSLDRHLVFDVLEKIELVSVRVYSGSAGPRTIELRDNNGVVLQSFTRSIPAGPFRVTLNFTIDPGTDYQLGVSAGSQPDLYRNNSGLSYPYTIANKLSITRSNAGTPMGFYYYFYNWRIKSVDCLSPRTSVTAFIDTTCNVTSVSELDDIDNKVSIHPNPASSQLNINYSSIEGVRNMKVKNLTGKLIYQRNINSSDPTIQLNVAGWSKGIYVIQFETQNSSFAKKVIINH